MRWHTHAVAAIAFGMFLFGCAHKKAPVNPDDQRREDLLQLREDIISDVEPYRPEVRNEIKQAPGFAVFSNRQAPGSVGGKAEGYGVVFDNETNLPTYMKMEQTASTPTGSVNLEDYRVLMVFRDADTMRTFADKGWKFGAGPAEGKIDERIRIYRVTSGGVQPGRATGRTPS